MELQEGTKQEEENPRDKILNGLLQLSDRQFDPHAKEGVKKIIGMKDNEEARKEILFLLDECVFGSLCSDFEIRVLDILYRQAGGTDEEMKELLPEREARRKE